MVCNVRSSSVYLLLTVSVSVLCQLSSGQSCLSLGEHPQSTCSRSRPCRAENPSEKEYAECAPDSSQYVYRYPPSLPAGITRCRKQGFLIQKCAPPTLVNATLVRENRIESLSVELNSLNYRQFAVNVSWDHAYNPTGGYEMRVKWNAATVECFCIGDPDMRSIYLDDTLTFRQFSYGDTEGTLKVEVSPLIGQLPAEDSKITVATDWPKGCLEINHVEDTCGLPVYSSPSDVSVYKHFKSRRVMLDVQWHYETAYAQPTVYYVELFNADDINEYFIFIANNTNIIRIKHVDSSKQYKVKVQAYLHCSGLVDRVNSLGCGLWSKPLSPVSADLPVLLHRLHKEDKVDSSGKKA